VDWWPDSSGDEEAMYQNLGISGDFTSLLGVTLLRPLLRVKEQCWLEAFQKGTPHNGYIKFKAAT